MSQSPVRIGKYTILGTLGRGAMGVVYQGQDPEIGRIVAIKTLRSITSDNFPDKDTALARFRSEAQSAGNLRHPNIVTVFDANIANDIPYIVMDYVEGKTLATILQEHGKIPPIRAIHYLHQIALGLDSAHRSGVIHRDIKPTNIVVDSTDQAYILDFGVARMTQSISQNGGGTTEDEPIMGTPGYMSPEQILNYELTGRSDLFSFAIVAYECLTGRRPFGGKEFKDMIKSIVQDEPYPLTIAAPELPLALEAEFQRALDKQAAARFETAEAMISAFKQALGSALDRKSQPASAAPPRRERQPSEWKSIDTSQIDTSTQPAATGGAEATSSPAPQEESDSSGSGKKKSVANEMIIKVKPREEQARGGDDFISQGGDSFQRKNDGLALPGDLFAYESPMSKRSHDALMRRGRRGLSGVQIVLLSLACVLIAAGVYMGFSKDSSDVTGTNVTKNELPDLSNPTHVSVGDLKQVDTVKVDSATPVEALTDPQILSLIVDESSSEVRLLNALKIAGQRKIPGVVDASVVPLENASYTVRIETIKLLGKMGDKRIVPVLVKRLDDYDPLVRIQAAKVLGDLGSRSAVGYLSTRYFSESNDEVKKELKKAIEQINGFPLAENP